MVEDLWVAVASTFGGETQEIVAVELFAHVSTPEKPAPLTARMKLI